MDNHPEVYVRTCNFVTQKFNEGIPVTVPKYAQATSAGTVTICHLIEHNDEFCLHSGYVPHTQPFTAIFGCLRSKGVKWDALRKSLEEAGFSDTSFPMKSARKKFV